ncbi:MAG: homoserine O-acetyltransferase [Anaerolineae bacterium]
MEPETIAVGTAGIVHAQFVTFAQPPHPMRLESGVELGPITLAYETYGTLNAARTNAILVLHALSGDAHAAGCLDTADGRVGWWDDCIGPGKAFDTDRLFVICSNVLGGCMGSTGPASINPASGRPYGLQFPVITIRDMVEAQRHLLDHLGIERLLAVVGGSMGGMQALQWAASYPERLRACLPLATTARLSPQTIALSEVGRQAIYRDPAWCQGNYYDGPRPDAGLSLARMIGHITYLSDQSMQQKFGRRLQSRQHYGFDFATEFAVESYLAHNGDAFTRRFDANTYLYVTKAMDYFDLTVNGAGVNRTLAEALSEARDVCFLVVSFKSDWLYPSYQAQEIVKALTQVGADVTSCDLESTWGHDAFLLEVDTMTQLLRDFLRRVEQEQH